MSEVRHLRHSLGLPSSTPQEIYATLTRCTGFSSAPTSLLPPRVISFSVAPIFYMLQFDWSLDRHMPGETAPISGSQNCPGSWNIEKCSIHLIFPPHLTTGATFPVYGPSASSCGGAETRAAFVIRKLGPHILPPLVTLDSQQ